MGDVEEPRLELVVGCEEIHQVQIQPAKGNKQGVVGYEKRVGPPYTAVIPRGYQVTIINGARTFDKKSVVSHILNRVVHNDDDQQEKNDSQAFVDDCEAKEFGICLEHGDGNNYMLTKNHAWGHPEKQLVMSKGKAGAAAVVMFKLQGSTPVSRKHQAPENGVFIQVGSDGVIPLLSKRSNSVEGAIQLKAGEKRFLAEGDTVIFQHEDPTLVQTFTVSKRVQPKKRAANDEVQVTKPKRSRLQSGGGSSQKQPADNGNPSVDLTITDDDEWKEPVKWAKPPKIKRGGGGCLMESRRPNEVVVARCRLELRYSGGATPGPGLPERFVLDPEVTPFYDVGRFPVCGSTNGLTLNSGQQELMVSRVHARFEHVHAGQKSEVWTAGSPMRERYWKITDQHSTNGCMLNGVRVNVAKLSDGDTITFGGCGAHFATEIGEKPCETQPKSIYTFTIHYLDGGSGSAPGGSACRAPRR